MKMVKQLEILVFDFDGTMADSLTPVVNKMNRWAKKVGQKPFTEQSIISLVPQTDEQRFGFGWMYRQIAELSIRLLEHCQRDTWVDVPTVPKLMRVLAVLRKYGYRLGIVTSNSEENVKEYLALHGWDWLFSFVYANGGLFGKGEVIKRMLVEQGVKPSSVVYIGDEPRDVLAAREAGIKVAAVTWGYQPKAVFEPLKPDWILDKPSQLLELAGRVPWWRKLMSRWGR